MRKRALLLISLALSSLSCKSQQLIRELNIKNDQIATTLDDIIRHEKSDSIKDNLYIIKIRNGKVNQELRIANFNQKVFSRYNTGMKDSLLGFLNYRGYVVLVYGKILFGLFQETEKTDSFKFAKRQLQGKTEQSGIPYPPEVIEPTVWLFDVINNQIIFKEAGYFSLLE